MPKRLRAHFEASLRDKTLGSLREDIALADALLLDALSKLEGQTGEKFIAARADVLALLEQKRKLTDSEAQRLKDAHQTISIAQALAAMTALVNVVVQHVHDPHVIVLVREEFQRLTS